MSKTIIRDKINWAALTELNRGLALMNHQYFEELRSYSCECGSRFFRKTNTTCPCCQSIEWVQNGAKNLRKEASKCNG